MEHNKRKDKMKTKLFIRVRRVFSPGLILTACVCLGALTAGAQMATESSSQLSDGLAGFLVDFTVNYPLAATLLLVIGGLRVVFKPVMALLDEYVKANCSPEEYGRLQHFEAGSVYKWLNFAFDLLGSVKLPTVGIKPSATTKQ